MTLIRPNAVSKLAVALAVLLALLALPVSGAIAQTPATNTYISEQFGYQVSWPDDWTLVTTESEPGRYDLVTLIQDDATAFIIFSRPGDTPLSEIAEFMIDGPPTGETFVPGMTELDTEGKEIQGETTDRAWVAYAGNLAGEDVDGFTEFRYGEVRRLEGDLGVGLSIAMPAGEFAGDIAPYSALLNGVTKIGATPMTEQPSS